MACLDVTAFNQFDPKKGCYLAVVGKGEKQRLVVKKPRWLFRWAVQLLMKLGCHSASFSKVIHFLNSEKGKQLLKAVSATDPQLGQNLQSTLKGRVQRYGKRHKKAKSASDSLAQFIGDLSLTKAEESSIAPKKMGSKKNVRKPAKIVQLGDEIDPDWAGQFQRGLQRRISLFERNPSQEVQLFASCFHTLESTQEISEKIRGIATPGHELLKELHQALPGLPHCKIIKVYLSDSSEKALLHYLRTETEPQLSDLAFVVCLGEVQNGALWQAKGIDFSSQLRFVGAGADNILHTLNVEIQKLSREAFGKDILEGWKDASNEENSLLARACALTFRANLRSALLDLKESPEQPRSLEVMRNLLQSSQVTL